MKGIACEITEQRPETPRTTAADRSAWLVDLIAASLGAAGNSQGPPAPRPQVPIGTKLARRNSLAARPVQNSPHTTPAAACPVQNSPSTSKNADFGPFSACWAKIFTLTAQPTDAGRILSRTGHVNTSSLKDKSPLREVLRAVVKHFSPTRVHKSQFWPFSTEQGRCFFHRRLMPGTRAIRWGDISFRTRPRQPTKPPTRTRPTRHQQPSSTARTGRPGRDAGE